MNTYRHNAVRIAIALCLVAFLLTGVAMAQDAPDILPNTGASSINTANAYVTQLDELRAMSQPGTMRTTADAAELSVYEFSSDLQRLKDMAAASSVPPTANDYITMLDRLRSIAAN